MSNAKNTNHAPGWKVIILAHSRVLVTANNIFPCGTQPSDMRFGFKLLIFEHNKYKQVHYAKQRRYSYKPQIGQAVMNPCHDLILALFV